MLQGDISAGGRVIEPPVRVFLDDDGITVFRIFYRHCNNSQRNFKIIPQRNIVKRYGTTKLYASPFRRAATLAQLQSGGYNWTMDTPPEIDELAKRYLDLWQEHLSGMATDPEWGAAMTRLFATFISSAMGPSDVSTGSIPLSEELGGKTSDANRSDTSKGPAPIAHTPVDGGLDIRELERRVAVLEERLARLADIS
jgi:hypothetical protein